MLHAPSAVAQERLTTCSMLRRRACLLPQGRQSERSWLGEVDHVLHAPSGLPQGCQSEPLAAQEPTIMRSGCHLLRLMPEHTEA